MIIVRITGGLGNQLFQYSTGRRLSGVRNAPLKLDISSFENQVLRKFELFHFNVSGELAKQEEIRKYKGSGFRKPFGRIYNLIQHLLPFYMRSYIKERHFHFDPDILKVSGRAYLDGYWQSDKYFKDIEGILRKELTVKNEPDQINLATINQIQQSESISIHVRRGDYLSNTNSQIYHDLCNGEYYQAAMEKISENVHQPHFYVFSDDINWVKNNLKFNHPVTYITHNSTEKDYEDLRLMSYCRHHIIANSSFSWWGAWLCTNPDKLVYAPIKWFNTTIKNTRDLLPGNWIIL